MHDTELQIMHDNNDNEIDTEPIENAAKAMREFGDAARKLEEKRKPAGSVPRHLRF